MESVVEKIISFCDKDEYINTSTKFPGGNKTNYGYIIKNMDLVKALKELPDDSVNLIILDPPYGNIDQHWDKAWEQSMWQEIITEISRVMKFSGHLICFGDKEFTMTVHQQITDAFYAENVSVSFQRLIWRHFSRGLPDSEHGVKDGRRTDRLAEQFEDILVYWYTSGASRFDDMKLDGTLHDKYVASGHEGQTNVLEYYKDKDVNKHYKTHEEFYKRNKSTATFQMKPEALLRFLIRTYTSPMHVVMDGCMRHGGTGVAALQENRQFIGVEIDKGAFKWAQMYLEERFPFGLCNLSLLKAQESDKSDKSDALPVEIQKRPRGRAPKSELFDGEKEWDSVEGMWVEPDNFDETQETGRMSQSPETSRMPQFFETETGGSASVGSSSKEGYSISHARRCGARDPNTGEQCTFHDNHSGAHSFEITSGKRRRIEEKSEIKIGSKVKFNTAAKPENVGKIGVVLKDRNPEEEDHLEKKWLIGIEEIEMDGTKTKRIVRTSTDKIVLLS